MSENSLDGLIAKIKAEGIDGAEKEAQRIIEQAERHADKILNEAEDHKHKILESAEKEASAIVEKGQIALQQAARDVQISVQNDLIKLLKSVLESDIKSVFTTELYSTLITNLTESLGSSVSFAIPTDVADELSNGLIKKLSQSQDAVTIVKDHQLLSGLSVTKADEGWTYNINAEEVSELLSQHLSQKWVSILNSK